MPKLRSLPGRLGRLPPKLQMLPPGDAGRREFSPWRTWYNKPEWRALRLTIFERDANTCRMCGRVEQLTHKLVADHRRPHRGDAALFWDPTNLQTLCKPCHDGPKQRAELRARV